MKLRKIGSILVITLILGLLFSIIPAVPAMAAVGTIVATSATGAASGPVGTLITISGTAGFTSPSNYTIRIDGVATYYTGAIIAGGTFPAVSFLMPAKPRGTHTIDVITDVGDSSNAYSFSVTPKIVATPASGNAGTNVVVTGSGFGTSAYVNVSFDSSVITSGYADANGSFTLTFQVPQVAAGSHTIACSDGTSSTTSTFTLTASMTASPTSGKVGSSVTLTGSGFSAYSSLIISLGGVQAASTQATSSGSFNYSLAIPAIPGGANTIAVTDGITSVSFPFTVTHDATINPTTFKSGDQVNIAGTGFAASSTVTLSIDNTPLTTGGTTTGANGSFSISNFIIPARSGGNHTLQVSDAVGASKDFNFTVATAMNINPTSGKTGDRVLITGSGYGASKNVTITFDGVTVSTGAGSPVTDENGALNAGFIVPTAAGGTHKVIVTDGSLSREASFSIDSLANMDPKNGIVGTAVNVSGSSFAARGNITVTFDNATVATIAIDSSGAFTGSFKVPAAATGSHNISLSDGTRSKPFTFTVAPKAIVDPVSGDVGTPVTVTGTGFASRGQIVVKYDTTQTGTLAADATGGFSLVFNAPVSKGGNHSIIITDGSTTQTFQFAMDSKPPPVPQLVLPPPATKADKMATLSWAEVKDPSGVTYNFELARDAAFIDVVFPEKLGLTTTAYTITEAEELKPVSKNKPYYWRVQAIDGASNQSAWSDPSTFYVGTTFPGWIMYAVFGVVAVGLGALGFWLGSRRKNSQM